MAAPTCLKLSKIVAAGPFISLRFACRRVTIVAMGNDTATLSLTSGEVLLKDGTPIVLHDRELGGRQLNFGGTISSISIFEELGAGS